MKLFIVINVVLYFVVALVNLFVLGANSKWPFDVRMKQSDYAWRLFFALVFALWGILVLR